MIKLSSSVIISLICLCQCSPKNTDIGKSEVKKITIVYKVPSLYNIDSAVLAVDSSCIYYYKKYRIYELPLLKGHFIENEFVVDSTVVSYVGYDTSKNVAFKIDYLHDAPQKRINIDSFIRTRPSASALPELLKNSIFDKDVKVSGNVYLKRYALNYEATDSLFLYFDKSLTDIPFSFSAFQDSANNAKLSRIELILKKDTSRNSIQFNQYRKVLWELSRSPADKNFPAIIAFCKKLENLYNKK